MKLFKRHANYSLLPIVYIISVVAAIFIIIIGLNRWENKIVEESKVVSGISVEKLSEEAAKIFETLNYETLFSTNVTNSELDKLDSILRQVTKEVLKDYTDFKGGFYLVNIGEFTGYAFPDSKPPHQAYGPPPRSYKIIQDQALLSVKENKLLINLYKFDPAYFPLATKPIIVGGKIQLVAWTRTHLENKLPISKLKKAITYIAFVSITVLIVLVYFSIKIRNDIQKINKQLNSIQNDPNYRLKIEKGLFGHIINSINGMLKKLQSENFRRHELEKKLHQKEKMASLGRITAGIAHEVKTPLAIIKTRIQMWQMQNRINKENNNIPNNESINMVTDEINRLSKLVNRLLIFARPIKTNLSLIDINLLLKDALFMMQMDKKTKLINFNTEYYDDLPSIEADENSLKQVFINVLSNSIEAISEKGAIFVKTNYFKGKGSVRIEITDTGKNISDDIINNIFEPFFTTKETGVGLGLAISYEIIKAHKGTIRFKNRIKEKGVKCIIELPVKQNNTEMT